MAVGIVLGGVLGILSGYLGWKWLAYRANIRRVQDLGIPQVTQFVDYLNILAPFLAKYDRDFWRAAPSLFASLKTPLLATTSSRWSTYHVNDAVLFKEVCVKKRQSFPKAIKMYDTLRIFGENIVTTNDNEWRRHRAAATHAFSDANNRLVFDTTVQAVDTMLAHWAAHNTESSVPVLEDITRLTLMIISSAAFGMNIDTFGEEDGKAHEAAPSTGGGKHTMSFTRCMETVSQNTVPRVLLPDWAFRIPLFNLPHIGTAFKEFDQYLLELIDAQRQQGVTGNGQVAVTERKTQSLLSLLVDAAGDSKDPSKRLDEKELLGNAFIFLLAGHETSAHALTFALALLALHQDKQDALYEEIKSVLGPESAPTYDDLDRLTNCYGVMNEALRLFPPVVLVPKQCTETTDIVAADGTEYTIPEGSIMNLHVHALHRNPLYYKDPDAFLPERWERDEIEHFAFAPFSLGERSCIGRKFAQITVITTLALLVQRYHIEVPEGVTREYLLATKAMLTLYPANPWHLTFRPRKAPTTAE